MIQGILIALCSIVSDGDTLEFATVSAKVETGAVAVCPVNSISSGMAEITGTIGLHEAIERFSGVSIKDYGGIGGLKTVSIRNMGAVHTSVMYDGTSITDAQNGQVDISRFNMDGISSSSVIIGIDDNIFRSARGLTSAGILKIESSEPKFLQGDTEVKVRFTAGSFNTYNPHISYSQKLSNDCSLTLTAFGTISQGNYPFTQHNINIVTTEKRINSDVSSIGGEANFYATLKNSGKLKIKANIYGSERGLPGPVILYTQNDYERLWDRSAICAVMYDKSWGNKWKFHADFGYTHSYNRYTNSDPMYPVLQNDRYNQNEYSLAARGLYCPSGNWKVSLASDLFVNTLSSSIPECPFPTRHTSVSAAAAEFNWMGLKINANLAATYISERLRTGNGPDDKFRLSPMIGLNWNIYKGLHIRASWKDSFRAPTFNDLYYARVGNTSLRPENGWQSNLGLTLRESHRFGHFEISADAYFNQLNNKITAIPTMFIWKMQNVGKVWMYGTDIKASATLIAHSKVTFILNANYSLQYATDMTQEGSKTYRHQIAYTPRHCGSSEVSIMTAWVNLCYRLNAVGARYSKGQNIPANEIAPYTDHSISINRNFDFGQKHDYRIGASLELLNLSDNNYEIIQGYPMPGRSIRISVKFKY